MQINYFNIRASLELIDKNDVYDADGYFLENKVFYVKDYFTKNFRNRWRLPEDFPNMQKDDLYYKIKKYCVQELEDLMRFQLLYKISNNSSEFLHEIFLTIKTAKTTDLFWHNKSLKNNIIYYKLHNSASIIGPFAISNFTDKEDLQNLIDKNQIFIPTITQLFEKYAITRSA